MTATTTTAPAITYVVPCGADKAATAAPARELYAGQMFRHTLAAAEAMAATEDARVLILSARHGLVDPDAVIAPYEQRIGAPGSITADELAAQALALGIDWGAQVYGMLPRAYLRTHDTALSKLDVYVQDVYEATAGIGEQRHVNAVTRSRA